MAATLSRLGQTWQPLFLLYADFYWRRSVLTAEGGPVTVSLEPPVIGMP